MSSSKRTARCPPAPPLCPLQEHLAIPVQIECVQTLCPSDSTSRHSSYKQTQSNVQRSMQKMFAAPLSQHLGKISASIRDYLVNVKGNSSALDNRIPCRLFRERGVLTWKQLWHTVKWNSKPQNSIHYSQTLSGKTPKLLITANSVERNIGGDRTFMCKFR